MTISTIDRGLIDRSHKLVLWKAWFNHLESTLMHGFDNLGSTAHIDQLLG